MNVRLKRTLNWSCGLVFQNEFAVNHYTITVSMITATSNPKEQNVAYERVKHFILDILENSVFISTNSDSLQAWQDTGARLIVFPDEPVDQIVGITLFAKLNSIMEQRIIAVELELSSDQGDDMVYMHSAEESLGPLNAEGWWLDSRPGHTILRIKDKEDKVVALDRTPEWNDVGLDWDDESKTDNSSVVFADFSKDENK